MAVVTIVALALGNGVTAWRLRSAQQELDVLRRQVGHLPDSGPGQIAAVRVPTDEPLTFRFRVRVPGDSPASFFDWPGRDPPPTWATPPASESGLNPASYRIAFGTVLPQSGTQPQWVAAVGLYPGESWVTVRVAEDPRDGSWKISTLVRDDRGTNRTSSKLTPEHLAVFRSSRSVVSVGLPRQKSLVTDRLPIRLLDERWITGPSLLLYGDRPPESDQVGIYAELQRADTPLKTSR